MSAPSSRPPSRIFSHLGRVRIPGKSQERRCECEMLDYGFMVHSPVVLSRHLHSAAAVRATITKPKNDVASLLLPVRLSADSAHRPQ